MYPCKDLDDVNEFDLREYQVKVKTEKEQIKTKFSCPRENKEFEAKIFYILEAVIFQPRLKLFI